MEARDRLIRRSDMVACKLAFIDCKMPGSTAKENYSLIGPGVTQSADQVVNITEAHGFSLGVAAMPPGTTNNLHVHYTAEVFMVFSGTWLFRWGAEGKDGEIIGKAGDVVSIPTWIFRGFTNVGNDDGWIFTALGGDDTGGIIWHPVDPGDRRRARAVSDPRQHAGGHRGRQPKAGAARADRAARRGHRAWPAPLRHRGDAPPGGDAGRARLVVPRAAGQRAGGPCEPDGAGDRPWHDPGPGERAEDHQPARVFDGMAAHPAGQRVGAFRLAEKQVLLIFAGAVEITLDGGAAVRADAQEVFSVPAGSWRTLVSVGDVAAEIAVLTAGDHQKHPEWTADIRARAAAAGFGLDHAGYIAPLRLLPPEAQPRAA